MLKKILPLLMMLIGIGAGVAAGVFLHKTPDIAHDAGDTAVQAETDSHVSEPVPTPTTLEYVKLNNQFVVPVVKNRLVSALIVVALSVEVVAGQKEIIYAKEPKIRDSFLQVLFDHANIGGFDGEFTNANNLAVLRVALREVARKDLGDIVTDVLIIDIARQDI
jgi:flagellar FliL protein